MTRMLISKCLQAQNVTSKTQLAAGKEIKPNTLD